MHIVSTTILLSNFNFINNVIFDEKKKLFLPEWA